MSVRLRIIEMEPQLNHVYAKPIYAKSETPSALCLVVPIIIAGYRRRVRTKESID